MFWKTQVVETATLNDALDKDGVTLEEILEDPFLLSEVKNDNPKLLAFLKERILKMVRLALGDPGGDWKDAGRYKYAHLSSEVLSANVEAISTAMFSDAAVRGELGAFLAASSPGTLNPLTASFYCKLMTQMLARQPPSEGEVLDFVKGQAGLVAELLRHLGTSAVMDVLFRLVSVPEEEVDSAGIKDFLVQEGLVKGLVDAFAADRPPEDQANASVVWNELVRVLRDLQYSKDEKTHDPLLAALQGEETLKALLDKVLGPLGQTSNSLLENGAKIFINLLQTVYIQGNPSELAQKAQESLANEWQGGDPSSSGPKSESEPLGEIWTPDPDHVVESVLAAALGGVSSALRCESSGAAMELSMGKVKGLGAGRLALVKLLSQLLNTNHAVVHANVAELKLMGQIVGMIPEYPYNNFLHSTVGLCISGVLFSQHRPSAKVEGGKEMEETQPHKVLVTSLIVESGLLDMILTHCQWSQTALENRKRSSPPFTAHLFSIAKMVQLARTAGPNAALIETALGTLSSEKGAAWEIFVSGPLAWYAEATAPESVEGPSESDSTLLTAAMEPLKELSELAQTRLAGEALPEVFGLAMDTFGSGEPGVDELARKATELHFCLPEFPDQPPGESRFEAICSEKMTLGGEEAERLELLADPFGMNSSSDGPSEGWADFGAPANSRSSSGSSDDGAPNAPADPSMDVDDPWPPADTGATNNDQGWAADFASFGAGSEASEGFAKATSEAHSPGGGKTDMVDPFSAQPNATAPPFS